ncbi:hypothetical protein [Devosia aurantiaca]|uniref:Uncharacterized protein n=1 Tax=Devosia aurantiaca TaxID=2714858 RepID=A0A6M1SLV3_9HYPH|nr:hypothetical protein [Devosia aurantiaca]NGP16512.1 hypothetical protein [Devosia aurantiaca]
MTKTPRLRRNDAVMIAHLQQAWERAGFEGLDPYLAVERERKIFETVLACDPTPQGRYADWLSRWRRRSWPLHGMRGPVGSDHPIDLAQALAEFEAVRHQLRSECRDVNTCMTASDLKAAATELDEAGIRARRRHEKASAMLETEFLHDDGVWRLIRLKGRQAAVWWGKGTRWCTSSTVNPQHYLSYAAKGDLLVLETPMGRFQLATATGEFCDAADAPVDMETTLRNAPTALRRILSSL